jgi:hypothetical protein
MNPPPREVAMSFSVLSHRWLDKVNGETLVRGNTNAASIVIAEKAADPLRRGAAVNANTRDQAGERRWAA